MTKSAIRVFVGFALSVGLAAHAGAAVKICRTAGADVFVDNTGAAAVSAGFQKCIDDNAVTVISLPPGTYLVDTPIIIRRSGLTIATAGLGGNIKNCQQLGNASCAALVASTAPMACINNPGECHTVQTADGGGLLQAKNVKRVIFDHLIIDGNRAQRGGTEAQKKCLDTTIANHNRFGFNSQMTACEGTTSGERCEFTYNFTRNALCGTGLLWSGNFGRIQGNAVFNNGVHSPQLWADGITVNRNNNGIVNDNHFVNNTDVALIFGEAANTKIQSNWIEQNNGVYAFAALMLGNFAETGNPTHPRGDYTGAMVSSNTIQCPGFWCGFGINFGPDPWTPLSKDYPNVYGGKVTQNNISGARVLINFGGAGTSDANAPSVTANTLSGAPTSTMPIAPGSTCIAAASVKANLPNNKKTGVACDNWVATDASPLSALCFKQCF